MMHYLKLSLAGLAILALLGCDKTENDVSSEKPHAIAQQQALSAILETQESLKIPEPVFKTIEWTDLMPKDDLKAWLSPPSYVTDVDDGSFEDQISNQLLNSLEAASDDRYQQALVSSRVVPEMDGQSIRIPGFIVPLEFNDEQTITQFFLVPFFGACIHVPPPPPNQIIFVDYPQGIKQEELYDPFWISGILKTSLINNEIATAAYTMQLQSFELYSEE